LCAYATLGTMSAPIVPGQPQQPYSGQPPQPVYGLPERTTVNPTVVAAILVGLLVLGGIAYFLIGHGTTNHDVKISSCTFDGQSTRATVLVTNSGAGAATYDVTVEFDRFDGGRLPFRQGFVDVLLPDVQPGHTAHKDAVLLNAAGVGCSVSSVSRY
jgi:hypothetical protein